MAEESVEEEFDIIQNYSISIREKPGKNIQFS